MPATTLRFLRGTAPGQPRPAPAGPAVRCAECRLRPGCLPAGLTAAEICEFEEQAQRARALGPGDHLFRVGDEFQALFAVRRGCLKTYAVDTEGREHVLNFYFPGEIVGLDAIYPAQHVSNAVALTDTLICCLPYRTVLQLSGQLPALQTQLTLLLSRDLFSMMSIAGDFTAEERLAAFLLMVSARMREGGAAPSQLRLAMSRQDIANYLRLATETVSRILARFQKARLLKADRKEITLVNVAGLQEIGECMNPYARCGTRRPDWPAADEG